MTRSARARLVEAQWNDIIRAAYSMYDGATHDERLDAVADEVEHRVTAALAAVTQEEKVYQRRCLNWVETGNPDRAVTAVAQGEGKDQTLQKLAEGAYKKVANLSRDLDAAQEAIRLADSALAAMLKAADELMTEFVSKKRAADWGIINAAMIAAAKVRRLPAVQAAREKDRGRSSPTNIDGQRA